MPVLFKVGDRVFVPLENHFQIFRIKRNYNANGLTHFIVEYEYPDSITYSKFAYHRTLTDNLIKIESEKHLMALILKYG